MSKIYSRFKIQIPNICISAKKKKRVTMIIFFITVVVISGKMMLDAVNPIFDTLCENEAKSLATLISNEQAVNVIKQHSYDEIFLVEKDSNGNVTMIKSNMAQINAIISEIAIKIQKEINMQGRDDVQIALGSFTGMKLLAGRGPGVRIKISSIGNVETDLKSEFESKGINQTLHRIYVNVKCEISVLTPFKDITKNIFNKILIMENIIIGTIPNTYYNIEGIDTNDTIEFIE